jgi:hypothetical protein
MVWQRRINCILAPYMAAFIVLWMPNTLLAQDCRCTNLGFGVCLHDYSCPSSGVDEHFLASYVAARREEVAAHLEREAVAREREAAARRAQEAAARREQVATHPEQVAAHLERAVAAREREAVAREQEAAAWTFPPLVAPLRRMKILETGYSLLTEIGGEEPDYGLYSYAIAVNNNSRSSILLSNLLSAIPPIEDTGAQRSQTNIFYIPIRKDKVKELSKPSNEYVEFFVSHANDLYDFKVARSLRDHLCDPPAKEIRAVCEGDLSRGPYIFSYAQPASNITPVPPPLLFMDLSDVHERAFPEIIAAFKAQVKREDVSDGERINTLRLTLLNIALKAADWLVPVQKAVADIVYVASGQSEQGKK